MKHMIMKISDLKKVQQLVLDIQSIQRNHNIPGTDARENVVEHSTSVAMLCWRIYDELKPALDIEKIFKYCLVHDYLERGLKYDVSTYASSDTRKIKQIREMEEFEKLKSEFKDFQSFIQVIDDYEQAKDEEAKFVWCVDKMQAVILGEIDNWRPYERVGVTYEQFSQKGDEYISKCPDFLKPTLIELTTFSRERFYDQPVK